MAPLRILHVGYGFRPLRYGGLLDYWEDLSSAQVQAGHEVAWFCPGRRYPLLRRPRLHRWTRDGVRVFEVLNGPIVVGYEQGTLDPLHDLDDPDVERLFARVLRQHRPDVIHIQELLGLPTALVDVARAHGVPTVMTLHDYFTLCPTLKLYDADERVNLRTEVGEQCARCCRDAPADARFTAEQTAWLHYGRLLERAPWVGAIAPRAKRLLGPVLARRRPTPPAPAVPAPPPRTAPPADYQRRREVNAERLGRVDRLIAISTRLGEIYRLLGVPAERMVMMPHTLSHLDGLRVRPAPRLAAGDVVHLATSNGCASREKGGEVVTGALERLHADGLSDRFRLTVLGYVAPPYAERLDRLPGVRRTGTYAAEQLDALLEDVDAGIVPSVWEEAHGFVGPEYLAKGIPVIGNAIGGITDYVREGETGWLNRDCSAEGLAAIVAGIVERPEQIAELHRSVLAARPRLVRSMPAHAEAMEGLYREVMLSASPAGRRPAAPAAR